MNLLRNTWKISNLSYFRPFILHVQNKVIMRRMFHLQGAEEITILANKKGTSIGQPSNLTHPHLVKANELVPGFSTKEFAERRERLVGKLIAANPKTPHIVLIPASTTQYMTEKIPYVFRQNTDFFYLTGCLEPDSALLITIESEGKFHCTMFVRDKNAHSELWEGPRTGVEMAAEVFGVDEAKSITSLGKELIQYHKQLAKCTFWYDFRQPSNFGIHKTLNSLSDLVSVKMEPIMNKIHELRLIKSKTEQEMMIKSATIASEAINKTISSTKPGLTEHQLFASVDYFCRMRGAEFLAYPPVVACGNNANIIHYINNNQMVLDGELVLMDAGCELHGYCSDITRTWPSNGKFTPEQATIYEIVLDVQTKLINLCSPERTLDDLFKLMCVLLGRNLKDAHILSKAADLLKLEEVAFKLCPHHVGHYLGMDVHDTGTVTRNVQLKDGMVITIEPGIYIDRKSTLTKPEFKGMGIRIEDDVLINDDKIKVLSSSPKTISQLEELCQS